MLKYTILIVSILNCLVTLVQGSDTVTLIKNGNSTAIIILADDPTPSAEQAAKDLQMWLRKISGAFCPIEHERQIPKIVFSIDTR